MYKVNVEINGQTWGVLTHTEEHAARCAQAIFLETDHLVGQVKKVEINKPKNTKKAV